MTTNITICALMVFLIYCHALAISLVRGKSGCSIGQHPEEDHLLNRLIIAHRNHCEHIPILCILLLLWGYRGDGGWFSLYSGWILCFARILYSIGILTFPLDKANPLRMVGSLLTYLLGFGISIALIVGGVF